MKASAKSKMVAGSITARKLLPQPEKYIFPDIYAKSPANTYLLLQLDVHRNYFQKFQHFSLRFATGKLFVNCSVLVNNENFYGGGLKAKCVSVFGFFQCGSSTSWSRRASAGRF